MLTTECERPVGLGRDGKRAGRDAGGLASHLSERRVTGGKRPGTDTAVHFQGRAGR